MWERVGQHCENVSGCWSLTSVSQKRARVTEGTGKAELVCWPLERGGGLSLARCTLQERLGCYGCECQQCRGKVGRKHFSNLLHALCKGVTSPQSASPDQIHVCEVLVVLRHFGGLS